MKNAVNLILLGALLYVVYKSGFKDGYDSVQFDMVTANKRLQDCIEVIR